MPTRYNNNVLLNTKFIIGVVSACAVFISLGQIPGTTITYSAPIPEATLSASTVTDESASLPETVTETTPKETESASTPTQKAVAKVNEKVEQSNLVSAKARTLSVPFFSQFTDITSPQWKKVGCGIASLAMLIEYYKPGTVNVDALLDEGISSHAYLDSAGWTYAGLIGISKKYGLDGASHDIAGLTMKDAFSELKTAVDEGPVMVSVHYTFDPKNPIPHLVILNGIEGDRVYYNDPAEKSGNGSISISTFQNSWKKRYIEIRPLS